VRHLLTSITFIFLSISINAKASEETFSFTESLEVLSSYEKDIIRVGTLDRAKSDNIREALIDIFNQSETQLSSLDSQISKKRERLAALLEEPEQATETDTEAESIVITPVVDQALLRNKRGVRNRSC